MDILSSLKKSTIKQAKRVGRGIGSGVGGHTTGRGAKGDNVRGHGKLTFDGTKIKKGWLKRLPLLRGKHRLLPKEDTHIISLTQISKWFKTGETVDKKSVFEKVTRTSKKELTKKVKILSTGELDKKLTFKGVELSKKAVAKVLASGGKIES
ncbi:MAG: 50S ribosomal protein L15 [Candidatus Shapirobacteria bacterium GW2011_GWE1_38_10]|uniref:Large ribosomal subunit protein uL15 n=1 Tax=Candidatus Shapirobacteria bacterium GW2011_GWE1_38_10 TaxID=1618488 RepID=A0A0G0I6J9_9BACT|nr:MAG: 50S ribosomal protein L15 [Candidatus Shapirobacteria bacterium GW2011_GWF2_37_20]KKQ50157.1 MAG: 50S ribosomal protein L15 [Candidatus Shapirobacteria bacterium GW2011_GWE1_38_10]KKQ64751.1 MAG: 50S ribosomal protein L15 [Candidatus Shapirobacteria bacterium GW2011_GWF1_38_23]HBP50908.1 50S ribosomal protein L15 [Candidatus Shapirobacteria bacterium]